MGIGFIWCAFDILRVLRWARLAIGARDDIDELSVRVQQPRSLVVESKPKIYMWHTPSIVLRKHVRAKCVCAFFYVCVLACPTISPSSSSLSERVSSVSAMF